MKDELILITPTKEHQRQAINFINEVDLADLDPNFRFSGFNSLEQYKDNYQEWLELIAKDLDQAKLPKERVTANTFFTVRKKDNKVVGIINIRHQLNDYLFNYGGHIGYCILPSERRKGYAKEQLALGLAFCKKINLGRVLITCADYNTGSFKTIEKAGGILENTIYDAAKGISIKRYWIDSF